MTAEPTVGVTAPSVRAAARRAVSSASSKLEDTVTRRPRAWFTAVISESGRKRLQAMSIAASWARTAATAPAIAAPLTTATRTEVPNAVKSAVAGWIPIIAIVTGLGLGWTARRGQARVGWPARPWVTLRARRGPGAEQP